LRLQTELDPATPVSAYAFGLDDPVVIAPKGWACTATVSQDAADYEVRVTSPDDPDGQFIDRTVSMSNGGVFALACSIWPAANRYNPDPREACQPYITTGVGLKGKHTLKDVGAGTKQLVATGSRGVRDTFLFMFAQGSPPVASNTECYESTSQHWCALSVETYLNPPAEWAL
jgi:hypothetical protein